MCRPADLDVVRRVAGVLGEHARRGGLDDLAAHPAREADALALDVGAGIAEEAERVGVAAELQADLLEDRVGVLLDQSTRPSSSRTSNGARVRVRNGLAGDVGVAAGGLAAGATAGPAAGAVDPSSVLLRGGTTARRRRPPPSGRRAATGRRRRRALGSVSHRRQVGRRRRPMGEGHRLDEVLLEPRLDRGLDLLDAPDDALDLAPRGGAQAARSARPVPAALPARLDVVQRRVGDQAEDHRVERVDLAAERAGQPDLVDRLDPGVVHQQADAGVERGLRELDRPDVVLGDADPRPARLAVASKRT